MADQTISKEPRYNLAYVMQETGIKADTLRAWERRYQLPQPQRTEGGQRLFSDHDIQAVKWLLERQNEGIRISQAVELWHEMESRATDPLPASSAEPLQQPVKTGNDSLTGLRDAWLQAVLNFDETAAEQLVTQAFAEFPMDTVCLNILLPGLSAIGTLWYEGKASVQQEHFASELATRRVQALISAAPKPFRDKMILVGAPYGENHTFPILLVTLLLRFRGWNVVHLGANVPMDHLLETIENTKPDLVVMNAMRLATAAALLETAASLGEIGMPIAFGGWIFNQIPGLAQKIPAYYLGGDVNEAISGIESLLLGPLPAIESGTGRDGFSETIALFQAHKGQIGRQVLDAVAETMEREISLENLQAANEFLAQDILAGLTLGDLSLVNFDLDWVERLIGSHDPGENFLPGYLGAYLAAARSFLHDPADPIIAWLTSIIKSKARRR